MEVLDRPQQEVGEATIDPTLSIDEPPFYEEALALEWTLSMDDIRLITTSVKGER